MAIKMGSSLFIDGHKVYRWRGDLTAFRPARLNNDLEELDLLTMVRAKHDVSSLHPDSYRKLPEPITGCACAMLNGRAYTFGGFSQLRDGNTYYRELYELDLATLSWQHLSAVNEVDGPMKKYLCGMVPCSGSELFIFGGFGEKCDDIPLQKGSDYHWSDEFRAMWTNEMHLYSLSEKKWIIPQCTGVRPPPCAAFSFTKIDKHRVLLFAGRQMKQRSNEIHILDMHCWHWSGAITQSRVDQLWPSERSLHTAACLYDPDIVPLICDSPVKAVRQCSSQSYHCNVKEQQVLVLWGQDSNGDQLSEAWILKSVSLVWERIVLPRGLDGRKWHSTIAWHPTPCESMVITMGGFEKDAVWNNPIEHDTVILHFGVKSLYKLCLKTVANYYSRANLTTYLPRHVIEEMSAQEDAEKQLNHQEILYYEI